MAVALDSTKLLYSKTSSDKTKKDLTEINNGINNNGINSNKILPPSTSALNSSNSYADSPSRQVRRSARVASLSPSSFTPLISDPPAPSGISSASSSSSFMPASPSRKYSLMRSGYQGVSIDEITINEIEPANPAAKDPKFNGNNNNNLRSNPDRKHPTLDFHPTNLNTPSTTLTTTNTSGITPSVKQFNLQETPSQRVLDKLVSKVDLEEIAKATPLGNKGTSFNSSAAAVVAKQQPVDPKALSRIQVLNSNGNSSSNSVSENNKSNNSSSSSSYSSGNSNTQSQSHTQSQSYSLTHTQMRTPQKQTTATPNSNDQSNDETVKIVRTLRNRSIVASPIPPRRHSLSHKPEQNPNNNNNNRQPTRIDVSVLFKRHQKNLLAYSLVTLFLLATVYHIYDSVSSGSELKSIETTEQTETPLISQLQIPSKQEEREEIVKLISQVSQEQLIPTFEQLIEDRLQGHLALQQPAVNTELLEKISASIDKLENRFKDFEGRIEGKVSRLEREAVRVKEETEQKFKEQEIRVQKMEYERAQAEKAEKLERAKAEKLKTQTPETHTQHTPAHTQHTQTPISSTSLKVVKHLSTTPLKTGYLFQSSQFPPENAITLNSPAPFKFRGNRGKLAVLLPSSSSPTHVVIQHPLLPDRSCAPRDIEIWGLNNPSNERDSPILLAKGQFDLSNRSGEQIFPLRPGNSFKILQLRIRNNHGNSQFTCLYKIKVFV